VITVNNSRRKFIKSVAIGLIGCEVLLEFPSIAFSKKPTDTSGFEIHKGLRVFNDHTKKNMEALVEALIPGANKAGVSDEVFIYVQRDKGAAGFFDAGLWNLDALSRAKFKKPFHELKDPKDINTLLNHVSVRNRAFFNQFRKLVIRLYFTNSSVWKKLSYNGPPQPAGFLDYSQVPKI